MLDGLDGLQISNVSFWHAVQSVWPSDITLQRPRLYLPIFIPPSNLTVSVVLPQTSPITTLSRPPLPTLLPKETRITTKSITSTHSLPFFLMQVSLPPSSLIRAALVSRTFGLLGAIGATSKELDSVSAPPPARQQVRSTLSFGSKYVKRTVVINWG